MRSAIQFTNFDKRLFLQRDNELTILYCRWDWFFWTGFHVAFKPPISCDFFSTEWAGKFALISVLLHLMPGVEEPLTEVFWALHTTLNSCVFVPDVCIQIFHLSKGLCAYFTLQPCLI